MKGDRDEIRSMQTGVRAWVLRVGRGSGRGLRQLSPSMLLSLLCAAAFGPVLQVAAGITGAAAVAGIGVLSSLGGGVLGEIIAGALDRLRSSRGREPSREELEEAVAWQIEKDLAAGDARAEILRAQIAMVLEKIDAGGTALQAAIETGSEQLRSDVVTAIGKVGAGFAELRFLLTGVERAAADILESLEGQDAKLRVIIDQNGRQLTEARLTREAIAAIELRIRSGAIGEEGESGSAHRWIHGSPYRGLLPFDEAHAEVFYGRERLTAELVGKLAERLSSSGLIMVTGASGAGKSSLLRAGMVPALARGLQLPGSGQWPVMVITPTRHPLIELATHLAALGGSDTTAVRDGLARAPGRAQLAVQQALIAGASRRVGRHAPRGSADPLRLVLIVDQFEQIFTLARGDEWEAERQTFITALCALATNPAGPDGVPPALVVIAVRGDFWDRCAAHPELADALQEGQFVVGPMSESDLRRAITGPADAAGLQVDVGLVDTVVSDMRSAGSEVTAGVLPLLSQAMLLTWENREGGRLTARGYGRAGGVDHAVQVNADAVYDALPSNLQMLARNLMRSMIVVSRNGQLARRPVTRADLLSGRTPEESAQLGTVLEAFAARRLVVLSVGTVQISHDALLHAWPRLRGWLEDDRASWIFYGQLAEDATAWHEGGKDTSFLYRGTQLAALQQAVTSWATDSARYPAITSTQHDFLDASARAAARSSRQRRILATVLVLLLMASLLGAGIADRAAHNADHQRSIAVSGQIAAESEESDITDPVTAALLAAAAWQIDPTDQARESMLDVLAQPERGLFTKATGAQAVAFSPNGQVLATAGGNSAPRLWDVATHAQIGAPLATGTGGNNIVAAVAFSPNGKVLATAGNRTRLWDATTHKQLGTPLLVTTESFYSVAFSPNGKVLATAGNRARLWDLVTHKQLGVSMSAGGAGVNAVVFSPNGKILATGSADGKVRLWDVATHKQLGRSFGADTSSIFDVTFSPNGTTLATASDDETARLWDVATHKQLGKPLTNNGSVYGAEFSPQGQVLATVGQDGTARLWDVVTHKQIGSPLPVGTGGDLGAAAFSPTGTTLATVNQGSAARLWDVQIYRQIGRAMNAGGPNIPGDLGLANIADSAAFGPNGKILATGSTDGAARLWDLATHRQIGPSMPRSPSLEDSVNDVAFSRDGKILATAANRVRLWNVVTHRQIGVSFAAGGGSVETVAFSPGGQVLATGAEDGMARLWDVTTHRQIGAAMRAGVGFAPKVRSVNVVAFGPDARILATASNDGTIRLWDLATHRQIGAPLNHASTYIPAVAFSPNGKILVTGSGDGTIQLWDVATHRQIGASFTAEAGSVNAVAFSPNGQILAAGSGDGTTQLWDVVTHHQISPPLIVGTNPIDAVLAVAVSPDGKSLITANYDGRARLWDIAVPKNLLRSVCAIAGRSLTPNEWATYIPSEPFRPVCP